MGVSARAMGMGGAFTAVADDSTAVFWNPSGLVQLQRPELSSMYLGGYDLDVGSLSTSVVTASVPVLASSAVGVGYVATGDPDLYTERTLTACYAQSLDGLSLPLSLGIAVSNLALSYRGYDPADPLFAKHDSSDGHSISAGVLYYPHSGLRLAAHVANVAASDLSLAEPEIPSVGVAMRVGAAYTVRRPTGVLQEFTLAAEFGKENITDALALSQVRAGVEMWIAHGSEFETAMRFGLASGSGGFLTLSSGAGVLFSMSAVNAQLDYAFVAVPDGPVASQHRISLSVGL